MMEWWQLHIVLLTEKQTYYFIYQIQNSSELKRLTSSTSSSPFVFVDISFHQWFSHSDTVSTVLWQPLPMKCMYVQIIISPTFSPRIGDICIFHQYQWRAACTYLQWKGVKIKNTVAKNSSNKRRKQKNCKCTQH